jgi:SRSO17 transposase
MAQAKQETRLAEDELRYWPSWHRHIALLMMAHA